MNSKLLRIVTLLVLCKGSLGAQCEIRVAVGANQRGSDPIKAVDWWSKRLATLQFDTLARFSESGELTPFLAERWYFHDGSKKLTIYLKGDARFSDGSKVDAKSVVESLKRYQGPDSIDQGRLTDIGGYKILGDSSFEIILKRPSAILLYYLATPRAGIAKNVAGKWIGSGPWVPRSETVFQRNPYSLSKEVACETLKLVELPFEKSVALLKAGDVDVVEYFTSGAEIEGVSSLNLSEFPTYDVTLILFTMGDGAIPLKERNWILQKLYNNPQLVEGSNRRLACSPLPLGIKGCVPPPCKVDWPSSEQSRPKEFDLYIPNAFENRKDLIDRIGRVLTKNGVLFHPHFVNIKDLYRLHAAGKVVAHLETFTVQIPDAYGVLSMYLSQSAENFSHFNNSSYDALVEKASATQDESQRLRLYKKAISTLLSNAMVIPLVHETRYSLVSKQIKNYTPSSLGPFYSNYHALVKDSR